MTRYHFNIQDGVSLHDEQGTEFPDLNSARSAAVNVLTEALRGAPDRLWNHGALAVTVTNEAGLTLFVIEATSTDAPRLGSRGRKAAGTARRGPAPER